MHISFKYDILVSLGDLTNISNCVLLQREQILIEFMQITNYIAIKRTVMNFQIL